MGLTKATPISQWKWNRKERYCTSVVLKWNFLEGSWFEKSFDSHFLSAKKCMEVSGAMFLVYFNFLTSQSNLLLVSLFGSQMLCFLFFYPFFFLFFFSVYIIRVLTSFQFSTFVFSFMFADVKKWSKYLCKDSVLQSICELKCSWNSNNLSIL